MQNFDVVVIGSGPGGYVAAIRSAQLGFKTAIIEREALGGVCLNVGCIPSKAMITATHLLHKAQHDFKTMGLNIKGGIDVDMKTLVNWKQSVCDKMSGGVNQLLKGNSVTIIKGNAEFKNSKELTVKSSTGTDTIAAKYFIVATGSRPIEIPGFPFDEKNICSSTGALAFDEIPKRVVVIGGGYIGLEISSYLRKLGTEVTVIEANSSLLAGVVDPECAQVVTRKAEKAGIIIKYGAKAKGQKKVKDGFEVTAEINGKDEVFKADKILVTVGRRPNGDQANLKAAGIAVDERGFIKVDAQRRTNVSNIFAIGDICGQPMLAHKASHEGVMVAEILSGANRVYDAKTVPAVVFTDPEIAAAGMTEAECRAKGYNDLLISKFPFAANGRAVSMSETDGFVKMIADKKTHVLLGVHIVGPEASNLISEAVLAIEMGARLEDLALSIHPHPTLGETMMEAAEATLGHAIHIIQKPLAKSGKSAHA
ncbi:dihydrolipoyl dehydrogenase [Pseudobdellovibrio exovorus]|uniref:Dihydrolipoyl dehydrogenase n=1 Tax=Pseudobdellovibrio exovorus JSS TaxID=1184267 RepID=M4VA66_9BACT|nr:dihydrolipoyl dehydrogenase [Pseudobdellovibrio exovorus]AGH94916.1 dihydrolipoamide dehydrogenase, E3 subunit [Pseudobdellovibrio exovorus JSS]